MTHYDEFGLPPTASLEEIQRAHRSLAKLLHPDPIQDGEVSRVAESQLKRLNGIYSILVDPGRRQQYDLQTVRPLAAGWRMPPGGRWWMTRWCVPAGAAALSLVAGFQAANWWGWANKGRAAERIVYLDRQPGVNSLPVSGTARVEHRRSEGAPPDLADSRELRRMLNQVISERDHALARLTVLRPTAAAADTFAIPAVVKPTIPAINAEPPPTPMPGNSTPPPVQSEAPQPARPGSISGTWIFSAPSVRTSPPGRYAAEYIEMLVTEKDSLLWGRYRARYKVPDRAISPEVQFFFEGVSAGERRYAWRGEAGSAGEIQLRLLPDATLSVIWFTNQFGRGLTLASGTAVLVRRRQD